MARVNRLLSRDDLTEILSPAKLNLPERPKIVDIKVEEIQDWAGEDSLDVWLILDDSTTDEEWTWKYLEPAYEAVREALRQAGESRFPYIEAGKQETYERRYDYDPETDE